VQQDTRGAPCNSAIDGGALSPWAASSGSPQDAAGLCTFDRVAIPAARIALAILFLTGLFVPLAAARPQATGQQSTEQKNESPSASSTNSQAAKPTGSKEPDTLTIRIEVRAGEKDKPVENASVYVRYNEPHKIKRDRLVEMNVKTNQEGKVKVTLVPRGKVLIQVIAEGWKTFGRWFDVEQDQQVIKIHLDKPTKWY
jgi:hypothetical protein